MKLRDPRLSFGQAISEFLIVALVVLLPLMFGVLEFAQLSAARNALNFAVFEAARAGSVSGGDIGMMHRALARGLVPLFAPIDLARVLASPGGSPGEASDAAVALGRATLEVLRPDVTHLVIENPRAAAFADFAEIVDGRIAIPNDGLEFRNPYGASSGQTLRDANVLALRVTYCRQLFMPLIDRLIPAMLRGFTVDPRTQLCLAQRRLPIEAAAVVQMQSPMQRR